MARHIRRALSPVAITKRSRYCECAPIARRNAMASVLTRRTGRDGVWAPAWARRRAVRCHNELPHPRMRSRAVSRLNYLVVPRFRRLISRTIFSWSDCRFVHIFHFLVLTSATDAFSLANPKSTRCASFIKKSSPFFSGATPICARSFAEFHTWFDVARHYCHRCVWDPQTRLAFANGF